jgi:glutamate carboxypeptidase
LAQAQKLNPTEQKIAQYIDAHFAQTEQLLKDAVNINSGTLNTAGVKQVGDIFKKNLKKLGLPPLGSIYLIRSKEQGI